MMLPIIGPPINEIIRYVFPIGPTGIRAPKIAINRKPVTKNKAIEVNIAPPKIKKKHVNFIALLGSYFILPIGSFQTNNATK